MSNVEKIRKELKNEFIREARVFFPQEYIFGKIDKVFDKFAKEVNQE